MSTFIHSSIPLTHVTRWRTRDIQGDQFRQSKSSSKPDAGPPRDKIGSARYARHLPFQVFCCESGTHVVDPSQSYYRNIHYRAGTGFANLSRSDPVPRRGAEEPCLDSSQAYFCRDLWVDAAKLGMDRAAEADSGRRIGFGGYGGDPLEEEHRLAGEKRKAKAKKAAEKRDEDENLTPDDEHSPERKRADDDIDETHEEGAGAAPIAIRPGNKVDADANAGSDYDAMPDTGDNADSNIDDDDNVHVPLTIPNSSFRPARILVNPRCVTTYAGVSHAQLALDLFGPVEEMGEKDAVVGKYVLEDWEGAPESFVCQEQRSVLPLTHSSTILCFNFFCVVLCRHTGGRKATKTQRRLGFSIYAELER